MSSLLHITGLSVIIFVISVQLVNICRFLDCIYEWTCDLSI